MGQVDFTLNSATVSLIGDLQAVASNVTSQFIVSPSGAPPGVNGYVFDVVDDEEITLDADITDSWLETNSTIQDHIALKPVRFTLHGFVGEIKQLLQVEPINPFVIIPQLISVAETLPVWSTEAQQVYQRITNTFNQAEKVVNQTLSVANLMNQLNPTITAQQNAYATFFGMWSNRILCTIQTPYGLLTSMAIESVKALQTGKTRQISDFSVTFKQIQTVGTSTSNTNVGNPNPAGSATQSSPGDTLAALSTSSTELDTNRGSGNTPGQEQTPLGSTDTTSGRISDALAPIPIEPGPDTPGSPTLTGTLVPVNTTQDLINSSELTGTATLNPVAPIQEGIVPSFNSQGNYQSPFQGYQQPTNIPVPALNPIPVSKTSLYPVGVVGLPV